MAGRAAHWCSECHGVGGARRELWWGMQHEAQAGRGGRLQLRARSHAAAAPPAHRTMGLSPPVRPSPPTAAAAAEGGDGGAAGCCCASPSPPAASLSSGSSSSSGAARRRHLHRGGHAPIAATACLALGPRPPRSRAALALPALARRGVGQPMERDRCLLPVPAPAAPQTEIMGLLEPNWCPATPCRLWACPPQNADHRSRPPRARTLLGPVPGCSSSRLAGCR